MQTATGMTPEFEQFVLTRAATLIVSGAPEREAIERAMADGLAWLNELAEQKTPKAQAFTKAVIAGMYEAAREGNDCRCNKELASVAGERCALSSGHVGKHRGTVYEAG